MKRYVGIDVAQEQSALCVVDDAGSIIFEGLCTTGPDEIVRTILTQVGDVEKVVNESAPLSIWLTREAILTKLALLWLTGKLRAAFLSAKRLYHGFFHRR